MRTAQRIAHRVEVYSMQSDCLVFRVHAQRAAAMLADGEARRRKCDTGREVRQLVLTGKRNHLRQGPRIRRDLITPRNLLTAESSCATNTGRPEVRTIHFRVAA